MLSTADVYKDDQLTVGSPVEIEGVLLGGKNLFVTDSIECFDNNMALPIVDETIYERLYESGVYSIGGGRFGFSLKCKIKATLSQGTGNYGFSLTNLVSIEVLYDGRMVLIPSEAKGDSGEPYK